MKRYTVILSAGLVLASPALVGQQANAQITKQGSGYLMRIKWSPGKSYNFNIKTSVRMSPPAGAQAGANRAPAQPMVMNGSASLRVVSVSGGVATVEVTTQAPGMGGQSGGPNKATVKMNSRGVVQGQGNTGVVVSLPEKPVAIGQSWNSTANSRNPMGGQATVTSRNTLKSVKRVGSRQVAEIETKGDIKGGGMSGTANGIYTVDMSDGMMLNYRLTSTMTMTMAAGSSASGQGAKPQKVTIPVTMELTRK